MNPGRLSPGPPPRSGWRRRARLGTAVLLAALAAVAPSAPQAAPPAGWVPFVEREAVRAFVDEASVRHGLDPAYSTAALARARHSPRAVRLNARPVAGTARRDWFDYRARQIDARQLREAIAFGHAHRAALLRAQQRFGVPAEVVIAILGIESRFGRLTGSFRTLDVLATLAFDDLRRAGFYREQLAHYLAWCREHRLDPAAARGSYAGAIGLPQFMPGSLRAHALDFDADGRIDVSGNPVDAIGSVASFLAAHGWQRELPVAWVARAPAEVSAVHARGIRAETPWAELAAAGVHVDGEVPDTLPVLLIDLPYVGADGLDALEHRVGTVNLAALLQYNRSYFYASVVTELAAELRRRNLFAPAG